MSEIEWRKIPGFSGYSVSENGELRRDVRMHNSMPGSVSQSMSSRGYYKTTITSDESGKRTIYVHVLVAAAFHGSRPKGLFVCHNDGKRINNHYSNLRYDTPKSNTQDAVIMGTLCTGERHPASKLKDCDIKNIDNMIFEQRMTQGDVAKFYGVSQRAIWQAVHRVKWRHIPRSYSIEKRLKRGIKEK